jgi:V8-like Glu-specific endopeptidase
MRPVRSPKGKSCPVHVDHGFCQRPSRLGTSIVAGVAVLLSLAGLTTGANAGEWHSNQSHAEVSRRPKVQPSAHVSIVGGRRASPDQFPWMALIVDTRGERIGECSGTVISPRLVLTAGHCLVDIDTGRKRKASGFQVFTGAVDRKAEVSVTSGVTGVSVYPHFKRRGIHVGWGDAGLLELSDPVSGPFVRLPLGSYISNVRAGTHAIMIGWGATAYRQTEASEWLMWTKTVIRGRNCGGFGKVFSRGQLCTLNPLSYPAGGCLGDSGGPLIVMSGAQQQVPLEVGVIDGGSARCSTQVPSISTRTDILTRWIHRRIVSVEDEHPNYRG